jgi:hypothetical protein
MVPVLYSEIGPARIEFEPFTARSTVIAQGIESRMAEPDRGPSTQSTHENQL